MGGPLLLVVEWYDRQRLSSREFVLKYFEESREVEMYDVDARRVFLKKSPMPFVLEDLRLGASFVLYSRTLKIVRYGDDYTEARCRSDDDESLVVVTRDASGGRFGEAMSLLEETLGCVRDVKLVRLNNTEAFEFSENNQEAVIAADGPTVALKFARTLENCQKRRCVNSLQCPESAIVVDNNLEHLFFQRPLANWPTARFGENAICCVIKPHVLKDKRLGALIAAIEAQQFHISAMQLFKLEKEEAAEFLEAYDGVLQNFQSHVTELSLGPCVALEIQGDLDDFRDFCGPLDVDFAKELKPKSLRALFGRDAVRNAVHCTDLKDDGDTESRFFFR